MVRLLDAQGKEVAQSSVKVKAGDWKKQTAVLTAQADVEAAVLSLEPELTGELHLDMISLFPQKTFKGHKNGLRADLAQTLADLHPRFMRFPGGCVAHGNGIDNIYRWKIPSVRWKPASRCGTCGGIIRRWGWDISNISSSAKI